MLNLRDELADIRTTIMMQLHRLDRIDDWLASHVVMRKPHHHGGNTPSPAKPRPRREFNDNMLQLLHERGRLGKPRSVPEEMLYFSLDSLLDALLSSGANSSPAPAAAPTGPRSRRRATPAPRATSSNATKRGGRRKGGK